MDKRLLRSIPSIDDLLETPVLAEQAALYPNLGMTPLVRSAVTAFRAGQAGEVPADREAIKSLIADGVLARISELRDGGMRRVINATGVLLHTNLGRAVLGASVVRAMTEAAGYTNLEIDMESGRRSKRAVTLDELLCLATGAESAMVVNNNAAAVYLVVGAFSPPGRVLVSRGELVEIGGSFRLPDILHDAASEVVELGTTNRTYAKDYEDAARAGDLILRAHRSNYDIQGFTHEASLKELVDVAKRKSAHVVYDLGSGSFFDYGRLGVGGEETVQQVLDSGVDGVTMSGDKLLGGMQAGIVLGTRNFLARLRENPLRRAVRVDKITIAAMQALLRDYLFSPDPVTAVPVLAQTAVDVEALRQRCDAIVAAVAGKTPVGYALAVVDDDAVVGGGSFAGEQLASVAVAISCEHAGAAEQLSGRLRALNTPVMARIKDDHLRLNLRSVLADEDGLLGDLLLQAMTSIEHG